MNCKITVEQMLYYIAPRFSGQILPHVLLINLPVSMSSYFPSQCLLIFYPFCRAQIPEFNVLLLVALVPKFQNLVIGYWMCPYSIWLPLNCVSFFCKSLLSPGRKRPPTSEEEVGRHSRSHPVFHPPIESGSMECHGRMVRWNAKALYVPQKKKKKKGKSWQRALAINLNKHNHK